MEMEGIDKFIEQKQSYNNYAQRKWKESQIKWRILGAKATVWLKLQGCSKIAKNNENGGAKCSGVNVMVQEWMNGVSFQVLQPPIAGRMINTKLSRLKSW